MSGTVSPYRPVAPAQGMAFGRGVRAFDWLSAAALANHVRGRGSVLIPSTYILETIASGTVTRTYRFRVKPNIYCTRRVWFLELLGTTAGVATTCSVSVNGGAAQLYTCSNSKATMVAAPFLDDLTSTASEVEITVAVTSSATGAVQVVSALCAEIPRAELDTVTDDGVDLAREAPTAPIDVASVGQVALAGNQALIAGRRVGMHHLCLGGSEGSGYQFTGSTAFQSIYTAGCEAPILGRYLYTGDTTRTLTFKAYGKISGGATLSVKLTMTNGATTTITTTSAAGVWFGSSNTIAVDAEDLTVADGRRSARYDVCKIEVKTSSAAQTLNLYSVSIWEDT